MPTTKSLWLTYCILQYENNNKELVANLTPRLLQSVVFALGEASTLYRRSVVLGQKKFASNAIASCEDRAAPAAIFKALASNFVDCALRLPLRTQNWLATTCMYATDYASFTRDSIQLSINMPL